MHTVMPDLQGELSGLIHAASKWEEWPESKVRCANRAAPGIACNFFRAGGS